MLRTQSALAWLGTMVAACAGSAGCQLILGLDEHADVADGSVPDGATTGDAAPAFDVAIADALVFDGGVTIDGGGNGDAALDAKADAPVTDDPCGSLPGPSMVRVQLPDAGSFCIDSTEVTMAEYDAFISAHPDAGAVPHCGTLTDFTTDSTCVVPFDASDKQHPVVCVTWCQAYAYCAWAHKRLCGKIDGGANAYADFIDPTSSQWYAACSNSGAVTYPYGTAYDAGACNGGDLGVGAAVPVGSMTQCQGGARGLFDMSGNVFELENSCEGEAGSPFQCHARGGSYTNTGAYHLRCDDDDYVMTTDDNEYTGFRCCKD